MCQTLSLHRHCRPWADLSGDILSLILTHLTFADHLRFTAVCRPWKLAAASDSLHSRSLHLPWLLLHSDPPNETEAWALVSPLERKLHWLNLQPNSACFGSSMGCLMLHQETNGHHLFCPFTNNLIHLPNHPTVSPASDRVWDCCFDKAVLLSSPSPSNLAGDRCVLAAVDDSSKPLFCTPRGAEWSVVCDGRIADVLFSNGFLYCLTFSYNVMVFEFRPEPVCRNAYSMRFERIRRGWNGLTDYLVECAGRVLLVVKYWIAYDELNGFHCNSVVHVTVHRLDTGGPRWVEVRSLGDEMLLLGEAFSVSVRAENLSGFGFKGNCIYFTEGVEEDCEWCVFCLEDEKVQPFYLEGSPSVNYPLWLLALNA